MLPSCKHKGYGEKLMRFAFDKIKGNGGKRVSIAIIDEHTVLKNWYKGLGFREISKKDFPHLPFIVCFMELDLL